MALAGSSTVLSTLIKTKMAAKGITIADDAELSKLTESIAEAVVEHIVAVAQVAMDNAGVDTNADTLVTNTGTVL